MISPLFGHPFIDLQLAPYFSISRAANSNIPSSSGGSFSESVVNKAMDRKIKSNPPLTLNTQNPKHSKSSTADLYVTHATQGKAPLHHRPTSPSLLTSICLQDSRI